MAGTLEWPNLETKSMHNYTVMYNEQDFCIYVYVVVSTIYVQTSYNQEYQEYEPWVLKYKIF